MRKIYIWIIIIIIFLALSGVWHKKINSPAFERLWKRNSYAFQAAISSFLINNKNIVRLDIPFHRQEHSLSCEIASLKMALNFYGVPIEENELLINMPFVLSGQRDEINNIWGDPDIGFVGNIDGKIPNGGYGIYESPIANLAAKYRNSKAMFNASLGEILQAVKDKHPVIVWGSVSSGQDISWTTRDGKMVKAVFGEHTRVLSGFSGPIDNPTMIYLTDPIYGNIRMSKNEFLTNWGLLDNRAVIVY